MIEIKKEVQDEILDFIKLKTGAPAALVICCTSTVPCKEEKDGKGCFSEHLTQDFSYGVDETYQASFLVQAAGVEIMAEEENESEKPD